MLARQQLERLTEMIVRLQGELENSQMLSVEIGRVGTVLVEALKGRLGGAVGSEPG
jgi:hypothetical protein